MGGGTTPNMASGCHSRRWTRQVLVPRLARQALALAAGAACLLKEKERGYAALPVNPEVRPVTVETDEFDVPRPPGLANTDLAQPKETSRPLPPSVRRLSLEQPPVTGVSSYPILPQGLSRGQEAWAWWEGFSPA